MGKRKQLIDAQDPADLPMTDDEWEAAPRVSRTKVARLLGRPPLPPEQRKRRVTLHLDPDVIDTLKADGKGWQTRANATLRKALDLE